MSVERIDLKEGMQLLTGVHAVLIEDGHPHLAETVLKIVKGMDAYLKSHRKLQALSPIASALVVRNGNMCSMQAFLPLEFEHIRACVYANPFPNLEWPLANCGVANHD